MLSLSCMLAFFSLLRRPQQAPRPCTRRVRSPVDWLTVRFPGRTHRAPCIENLRARVLSARKPFLAPSRIRGITVVESSESIALFTLWGPPYDNAMPHGGSALNYDVICSV
jgi:hypothetical protein